MSRRPPTPSLFTSRRAWVAHARYDATLMPPAPTERPTSNTSSTQMCVMNGDLVRIRTR